jgi:hypothetical protein
VASRLGEEGDWDSGPLVQGLQLQVEERVAWLQQSLSAERERRREEQQREEQQGAQLPEEQRQQREEERLIPDVAELRLLRQLELELARQLTHLEKLHPELARAGEADAIVLRELQRLATRHERVTALFALLRARLDFPDPDQVPADLAPTDEAHAPAKEQP